MKILNRIFLLFIAFVLTACPNGNDDYEFDYEIIVTETPANLEGINSQYDDYNSDLPYPGAGFDIYFSSNRTSGGNHFDIIHKSISISYHAKDDALDVHCNDAVEGLYEAKLFPLINSEGDELGPFSFFGPEEYSYLFYADNQDGNFDIRFVYNLKSDFGTYRANHVVNGPVGLDLVNSNMDDLYPSITDDQSQLLFCSNRENDLFNIYSLPLPNEVELHSFFTGTESGQVELNQELSSEYNDKCPSIYNDLLVFTSDREGGQGGFDLYFSLLVNGVWTVPVNFGPEINTEYDEYRPITFPFYDNEYLMIFSSNRPGGLGGFDLYMVKADSVIQSQ